MAEIQERVAQQIMKVYCGLSVNKQSKNTKWIGCGHFKIVLSMSSRKTQSRLDVVTSKSQTTLTKSQVQ